MDHRFREDAFNPAGLAVHTAGEPGEDRFAAISMSEWQAPQFANSVVSVAGIALNPSAVRLFRSRFKSSEVALGRQALALFLRDHWYAIKDDAFVMVAYSECPAAKLIVSDKDHQGWWHFPQTAVQATEDIPMAAKRLAENAFDTVAVLGRFDIASDVVWHPWLAIRHAVKCVVFARTGQKYPAVPSSFLLVPDMRMYECPLSTFHDWTLAARYGHRKALFDGAIVTAQMWLDLVADEILEV